jgi:hypothetical protein
MHSRADAKARATKLRAILQDFGHTISHANALEIIARQWHYKNWNTLAAALDKRGEVMPVPPGWQASGDRREDYDIGIDQSIMSMGMHPAVIRYKATAPDQGTGFATFMQSFDAVGYRGKRVQFSSTLKSEECDGAVTIWLRADSDSRRAIAFDNLEGKGTGADNGPIAGNTDWTQRTIVLDVPEAATSIAMGFYVRGKGAGYAAGFALNAVSTDIPLSTAPTNGHSDPVNMMLRPDGDPSL